MARRRYLVTYDVRNATRLRKVFKTMKEFGEALQYSVFVCDLSGAEKTFMIAALTEQLRHTEDSLVIIDLGDSDVRGALCFEFLGVRRPLPSGAPPVL